jgi:hypothetical protein
MPGMDRRRSSGQGARAGGVPGRNLSPCVHIARVDTISPQGRLETKQSKEIDGLPGLR